MTSFLESLVLWLHLDDKIHIELMNGLFYRGMPLQGNFFETLGSNFISPWTQPNRESQIGLQTPGGGPSTPWIDPGPN